MKTRPRRRARALAAGITVLTLVACGGGDDAAAPPTTTTTTSATEACDRTPATTTTVPGPGPTAIAQPAQPTCGPGGSDYEHGSWRISEGGAGNDAWFTFEPVDPRPRRARLAIVMHGYGEYQGYGVLYELIRHTVRHGTVVVFPRWQTGLTSPCPGPFDIEPCVTSAVNGIRGALDHLRADPGRVQPRLDEASYYGFSFGGIVTTNMANRWEELELPEPKVVFLDDPHDGGLDGQGEPAVDDSLAGIPPTTLFQCHVSADGVTGEQGKDGSSCNAIFPLLDHLPADRKDLVLTTPDTHGDPDLPAPHGVCAAPEDLADAYDWNFCWKVWDALRSAAFDDDDDDARSRSGTPPSTGPTASGATAPRSHRSRSGTPPRSTPDGSRDEGRSGAYRGRVRTGDTAPDFELPDETGTMRKLSDLLAEGPVVLFFYPAAMTKGCTQESCHFRDLAGEFAELGAQRVGISADTVEKQQEFATRHSLGYPLLSDRDRSVAAAFGVKRGLPMLPNRRATFVIDRDRTVLEVARSEINMDAHADKALAALRSRS